MWLDPVVEEIHRIRDEIARECGYDLHRIAEYFREGERDFPNPIINLQPSDFHLPIGEAAEPSPAGQEKEI